METDAHITPSLTQKERSQIRDDFDRTGVRILGVTGYSEFISGDKEELTANQRHLIEVIQLARDLNAPFVRTFLGSPPGGEIQREDLVPGIIASLSSVLNETQSTSVTVLVETHDDWSSVHQVLPIVRSVDNPRLKILWDIPHSLRAGDNPDEAARLVVPELGYVHLKDELTDETGSIKPVIPGTGNIPIQSILAALEKNSYQGFLCFEWERKWHPEIPPLDEALPRFRSWIGHTRASTSVL